MIIRLTKAKNQTKPDILTCVRDDGSTTWWPLPSHFAEHDLLHYAVETTLDLNEAFFGLVAAGRDIADFGTRDGQKDFYPPDAIRSEFVVGVLQTTMQDGVLPDNAECMAALTLTAEKNPNLLLWDVTASDLNGIRAKMDAMIQKWHKLPAGKTMALSFP